jgi:hypothetical protein
MSESRVDGGFEEGVFVVCCFDGYGCEKCGIVVVHPAMMVKRPVLSSSDNALGQRITIERWKGKHLVILRAGVILLSNDTTKKSFHRRLFRQASVELACGFVLLGAHPAS